MHEDDGQLLRVVLGTPVLAALGVVVVDLDVQEYAVLGDHRDRIRAQRAEPRDVADPAPGDHPAPVGDAGGGTGSRQTGDPGGVRQDAAAQAHAGVSSESTMRRVKRPPMRVTIS